LKLHLHYFSKIKSHKEVTKQYELRFSNYFCLIIVGSGAGCSVLLDPDPDPGGPKTYESSGSATLFFETPRAVTRNILVLLVYLILRNSVGNENVGAIFCNSKNKLPAACIARREKLLAGKNFAGRTFICNIFTTQAVLTNTVTVK
jgi:hypothetical protein